MFKTNKTNKKQEVEATAGFWGVAPLAERKPWEAKRLAKRLQRQEEEEKAAAAAKEEARKQAEAKTAAPRA